MKGGPLVAATAAGALLCAYAGLPPTEAPQARVRPDYEAAWSIVGVRVVVHGARTVLKFLGRTLWLTVQDTNGVPVPYEREARYYRRARKRDHFTVWANARMLTFSPIPWVAPAAAAAPTPGPLPAVAAPPVVSAEPAPQDEAAALWRRSSGQLGEVRRGIAAGAGSAVEAKALGARLDRIAPQLMKAASAIVRVQFDTAGTEFAPGAEIARALVPVARAAERSNVHGRTDARIAGAAAHRTALARALAAPKYLVERGVDGNKIKVFALWAGDFIAPVGTVVGRALNRRVEIELVNQRDAELGKQATGRQGSQP